MSSYSIESIDKVTDGDSLIGGALMTALGLAYLAFEDFVLADFSSPKAKREGQHLGRALVGAQVSHSFRNWSGEA